MEALQAAHARGDVSMAVDGDVALHDVERELRKGLAHLRTPSTGVGCGCVARECRGGVWMSPGISGRMRAQAERKGGTDNGVKQRTSTQK